MEAVKILEYKRKKVQKSCYLKKKTDFNLKRICDNIQVSLWNSLHLVWKMIKCMVIFLVSFLFTYYLPGTVLRCHMHYLI